jgi:hypothetical protein
LRVADDPQMGHESPGQIAISLDSATCLKPPPNNKTTVSRQSGIITKACPAVLWNPERNQKALVNR